MKPWVRVHRPVPGSAFETRLSAKARMLWRGVLPLFDDEGVLELGKAKTGQKAFASAVGYSGNEARGLWKPLNELLSYGCIVIVHDVTFDASTEDVHWTAKVASYEQVMASGVPLRPVCRVVSELEHKRVPVHSQAGDLGVNSNTNVSQFTHSSKPATAQRRPIPAESQGCQSGTVLALRQDKIRIDKKRTERAGARGGGVVFDTFKKAWPYGSPGRPRPVDCDGDGRSEVDAYVRLIRAGTWRPSAPFAHFAASFGTWTAKSAGSGMLSVSAGLGMKEEDKAWINELL